VDFPFISRAIYCSVQAHDTMKSKQGNGQNPTMTDETHPKPSTRQRIKSVVGYPIRTPTRLFITNTIVMIVCGFMLMLTPSLTQKSNIFFPLIILFLWNILYVIYIAPFVFLSSLIWQSVFDQNHSVTKLFIVGALLWLFTLFASNHLSQGEPLEKFESYREDGNVFHWVCPIFDDYRLEFACVLYKCDSTGLFCEVAEEGRPCSSCNDNSGW
jgi:hypothetical protein